MKLRHFVFVLICIFSLLEFGCSKGGEQTSSKDGPITLAINTKPGDKQNITTAIEQHMTTKVMEQDLKIDQSITMDMSLTTKEVKDTSASFVFEGTFDRWAMKMDMNGAGMSNSAEFDTKDSTKNRGEMAAMMSQVFNKMIGQPFLIEMSKTGKVLKTNMKELMAKIIPPGSSNSMGDDAMGTVPFPDHPVKPGDTWVGEIEREVSGKFSVFKANYTLKEVKDGLAYLTFDGEIMNKDDKKKFGTMNGTYSIATATGMLKDGEIKMQIDMEVPNPSGTKQQVKMNQTIKMTGKS
jgi:uncharacterized protein DUF6263